MIKLNIEKQKNIKLTEDLNKEKENTNQLMNELKEEKRKIINITNKLNSYINKIKILNSNINSLESNLKSKNLEIQYFKNKENELMKSKLKLTSSLENLKQGEIIAVNFISIDQKVNYCLSCKNTDIFIKLEEKLYNEYPEYKELDTYFTVNGNIIKRFKTLKENKH